jgi:hypothetical protein
MTLYEVTERRSGTWKAVGVALGMLMALAATEWFVTYCAFSSACPMAEQFADWPLSALMSQYGAP